MDLNQQKETERMEFGKILSHKTSSLKNMSDRLKRKRNAIILKDKVALDD